MGDTTTNYGWTIPDEYKAAWYSDFVSLMNEVDAQVKANDYFINVKRPDYGAVGDGVTDDTAAIQAAYDAAYTGNVGTLFFPAGTYLFDSITKEFSLTGGTRKTVNILGAGSKATIFQKYTAADTDPFFDISTNASGSLEINSGFQGFTIIGSSNTSDGIKLTLCAYVHINDVEISYCDKAIHGLGFLVSKLENVRLRHNTIGAYLRKQIRGEAYVRPNLVVFDFCMINSNSNFGIDYGDGAMLACEHCDFEENGTTEDTGTGAIMIRSTVGDSTGEGSVSFQTCWFESNYGKTIQSETTSNSVMHNFDQIWFSGDEDNCIDLLKGRHMLRGVNAPSGTVVLAGRSSDIQSCAINTLTDTCIHRRYRLSDFSTGFQHGGRTPRISIHGDVAYALSVGDPDDVPTHIWTVDLTADRAVSLATTSADNGAKFRIVRAATSGGAFNLNVGTGPLKALATGTWCEVEYNGTAWVLTAYGAL